uniref:Uncharacterized protein n=1 Tax=Planktothricoides sp. SpSt-374 TaxID=2282167 RepID=A0A7C3VPN3_9CYAN
MWLKLQLVQKLLSPAPHPKSLSQRGRGTLKMSHIFLEKAVLSGWDDNFADLSVREFVRVNRIRVYFRDISDRV